MVARTDLLRPFALDNETLRLVILTKVLDARLGLRWDTVQVDVVDGIVTLRGRLDRRGQAVSARRAVEAQPGVVAVVDLLAHTRTTRRSRNCWTKVSSRRSVSVEPSALA